MLRITELRLPIDHAPADLAKAIAQRLNLGKSEPLDFTIFKRSYDARKKVALAFIYTVDVVLADEQMVLKNYTGDDRIRLTPDTGYHFVTQAPRGIKERPVVIGFGPCGIFAALVLAQMGLKPIVLERGKPVRERTQDTWALWRKNILNPESNVQFGEGGAGTFSDGKLYSQIKDPHFYGRKVMHEFVQAGAPAEILFVAKPHIGTFRLVGVVEKMRQEIIRLGGEIRFHSKVVGLCIEDQAMKAVQLEGGEELLANHVNGYFDIFCAKKYSFRLWLNRLGHTRLEI